MASTSTSHLRAEIGRKVRELREGRGLTQADLSKRLGLSQNRLSEVERGQGSFTAEQFLLLLRIFNVPVAHFSPGLAPVERSLQNALARLGAFHLLESEGVLPSERLQEAGDVFREVLVAAGPPRHVAALAPVLVNNLDHLNLVKLWATFKDYGLASRLGWLIENTLEAIRRASDTPKTRKQATQLRKATTALQSLLERIEAQRPESPDLGHEDFIGVSVHSRKTLEETRQASSPISHRWGILTALQPEDFLEALNGSFIAH